MLGYRHIVVNTAGRFCCAVVVVIGICHAICNSLSSCCHATEIEYFVVSSRHAACNSFLFLWYSQGSSSALFCFERVAMLNGNLAKIWILFFCVHEREISIRSTTPKLDPHPCCHPDCRLPNYRRQHKYVNSLVAAKRNPAGKNNFSCPWINILSKRVKILKSLLF